jgi:hypothetical protein
MSWTTTMKGTNSYKGPGDMDLTGKMFHSRLQGGTSPLCMPGIKENISATTLFLQSVLLTGSKEWLVLYFLLQLKRGMGTMQMMKMKTEDDD